LNYEISDNVARNDIIWLNSNLGNVIHNHECIDKGLTHVEQFYEKENVLSYEEIKKQYNVSMNVLYYHKIVQLIKNRPRENEPQVCDKTKCDKLIHTILEKPGNKTLGKKLYQCLIKRKATCEDI
jgi:hypothetical protein